MTLMHPAAKRNFSEDAPPPPPAISEVGEAESMARSYHHSTAVGAALLVTLGDAVVAVAGGAVAATVIGIALLEIVHSRRVVTFRQRMEARIDRLERRMSDCMAAVEKRQRTMTAILGANADDVSALVDLENRRIRTMRRINGDEPTGPNPRCN